LSHAYRGNRAGLLAIISLPKLPGLLIRPSRAPERCIRRPNTAHRSGGIVASRAQAFTQILHQPCGLIAPSTLLQAFGAWNNRQLEQFWVPFGEPWYPTEACDILPAIAASTPTPRMAAAPAAHAARCSRQRRESASEEIVRACVMTLSLNGFFIRMVRCSNSPPQVEPKFR
jgi:hypothetical protein